MACMAASPARPVAAEEKLPLMSAVSEPFTYCRAQARGRQVRLQPIQLYALDHQPQGQGLFVRLRRHLPR